MYAGNEETKEIPSGLLNESGALARGLEMIVGGPDEIEAATEWAHGGGLPLARLHLGGELEGVVLIAGCEEEYQGGISVLTGNDTGQFLSGAGLLLAEALDVLLACVEVAPKVPAFDLERPDVTKVEAEMPGGKPTERKTKRDLPDEFKDNGEFKEALEAMAQHVEHQHEIGTLTERDWRVLRTLYGSSARSGWKTLPAGVDWLVYQADLPRTTVRRALAALERAGWFTTVPFKEAPKWAQKAALERQAKHGGNLPRMVRLRVLAEQTGDAPDIYPEVPGLPWKQPAGPEAV